VALLAVLPALRPQPVPREGFRALRCSGAKRPWRAAAARSEPPNSEGSLLGGEAGCGMSGLRPCSSPAAGSPGGVPSSALQRGERALARRRRPQRTPQLGGVTARRRGRLWCLRPSPLLCARSRFPGRGSELAAAAGRKGLGAPRPPAANPPTRRGHRSAAKPTVACPAVAPALRSQPVPREGFRARRCSGAKGLWRAAAARSGPPNSEGSPLGGEADCGVSGRRPCSAPAAGSPGGVPSSALQRGEAALARRRRPQRTPKLEGVTARRRGRLQRFFPSPLLFTCTGLRDRGFLCVTAAGVAPSRAL